MPSEMVDPRQQAETSESRRTKELAGLYEISRILSEIGDFEPKAAAAMEKVIGSIAAPQSNSMTMLRYSSISPVCASCSAMVVIGVWMIAGPRTRLPGARRSKS